MAFEDSFKEIGVLWANRKGTGFNGHIDLPQGLEWPLDGKLRILMFKGQYKPEAERSPAWKLYIPLDEHPELKEQIEELERPKEKAAGEEDVPF